MKSDHRRELHANELERLTESIGKFFEAHGLKVGIGLVAAVVIGVGTYWIVKSFEKGDPQGTQELVNAATADDYQNIAENPNRAGWKARPLTMLTAGALRAREGVQFYFTGKAAGRKTLEEAEQNVEAALKSDKLSSEDRERALYLHAVLLESLCTGDPKDAIAAYKKLLDEYPKSIYKTEVENNIKRLEEPQFQQFYAFLNSDDRQPADRKVPQDRFHAGVKQPPPERPVTLPRNVPYLLDHHIDEAMPFPKGEKKPDGKSPAGKQPKGKPKTSGPELKPQGKTPDNAKPAKASKTP